MYANSIGRLFSLSGFVVALTALLFSAASQAMAPAEEVHKLVEDNVSVLVKKMDKIRPLYQENPELFYLEMEPALAELVDFRRIAARVMGKYGRVASKSQRDSFVETFKKSLFSSYSKALVESGQFTVVVQGAKMLNDDKSKATVDIDVSAENGNKYTVAYSMYLNAKTNQWLLENIIVSGINLGLAFRDRFEQEMMVNKGNMDKVIANWNAELEISTKSAE